MMERRKQSRTAGQGHGKNFCRFLSIAVSLLLLTGCGAEAVPVSPDQGDAAESTDAEPAMTVVTEAGPDQSKASGQEVDITKTQNVDDSGDKAEKDAENEASVETESANSVDITNDADQDSWREIHFRDVFGADYVTQVNPGIPANNYDGDAFVHDGDHLSYTGQECSTSLGVDVSHHQGDVNWEKVKNAGYDFAFLRIGYRGYGKEGKLCPDTEFADNYEGAGARGMDRGVYFFAQAVNETEAVEEADYVLSLLDGRSLELPVVYDPESILDDVARTDDVTGEQFTKNTIAFCQRIREAGYTPAVYCNMLWEAFELDLSRMPDLPVWYADYEAVPQTPYDFTYWQYSNEATVPGISGACDVNIRMVK